MEKYEYAYTYAYEILFMRGDWHWGSFYSISQPLDISGIFIFTILIMSC